MSKKARLFKNLSKYLKVFTRSDKMVNVGK